MINKGALLCHCRQVGATEREDEQWHAGPSKRTNQESRPVTCGTVGEGTRYLIWISGSLGVILVTAHIALVRVFSLFAVFVHNRSPQGTLCANNPLFILETKDGKTIKPGRRLKQSLLHLLFPTPNTEPKSSETLPLQKIRQQCVSSSSKSASATSAGLTYPQRREPTTIATTSSKASPAEEKKT
jgi:hypothetical protein